MCSILVVMQYDAVNNVLLQEYSSSASELGFFLHLSATRAERVGVFKARSTSDVSAVLTNLQGAADEVRATSAYIVAS